MPGNASEIRTSRIPAGSATGSISTGDSSEPSSVPPYWRFTVHREELTSRSEPVLPFRMDLDDLSSSSVLPINVGEQQDMPDSGHNSVQDALDDAASKPPASGANAVPLSPVSRHRRGLSLDNGDTTSSCSCLDKLSTSCSCRSSSSPRASSSATAESSDYMRPSSFLRAGAIFTGHQSFTSYVSHSTPATHSSFRSAERRNIPEPTSRRPYNSLSLNMPSWTDIAGSAIDLSMAALLSATPAFGYASGNSVNRSSAREEWEVHVCLSEVDYQRGTVQGVMKALNVPNSINNSSSSSPNSSSTTSASYPYSSTVTTSFTGEIVDLHNHSIWTRPSSSSSSSSSPYYSSPSSSPSLSSSSETAWLSANQAVDKTTDLEYWSRIEAFTSYGPGAEKEICRIAREGIWHREGSRRKDVGDWVLMRWKERDFVDCDAVNSGLTISGYYYVCLNRKNGNLTGFYYDPMSTPHQRIELRAAGMQTQEGASQTTNGHWFASYSTL